MEAPTAAGETGEQQSGIPDPRTLLIGEFLMLTGFIASLLNDLTDSPPDWRAGDSRLDSLQRLAVAREQLVRGIGLQSTISAELIDERAAPGRPVGFSSRRI